MRIPCPYCGMRDSREFSYRGAAVGIHRPAPDAEDHAWDEFVHLRDNPAGPTRELWSHDAGCATWVVVERNTVTHEVMGHWAASDVARGAS